MSEKKAVALGFFDGLHLGHMAVINAASSFAQASGVRCVITLFDRHPDEVLFHKETRSLMTREQTLATLSALGVGTIGLEFAAVADMSPEAFFDEVLVRDNGAVFVSCGYDFTFGKGGKGDSRLLRELSASRGVESETVGDVKINGVSVSSTVIRELIAAGDVKTANLFLGRDFSYDPVVIKGQQRGRAAGIPTINQEFPDHFAVPATGVYASYCDVFGTILPSVTDVGIRPTVGGTELRSETHIIGFDGDLYGKRIKVSLTERLRDEIRFPSLDAVARQVAEDCKLSAALFEARSKNTN